MAKVYQGELPPRVQDADVHGEVYVLVSLSPRARARSELMTPAERAELDELLAAIPTQMTKHLNVYMEPVIRLIEGVAKRREGETVQ